MCDRSKHIIIVVANVIFITPLPELIEFVLSVLVGVQMFTLHGSVVEA